MNDPILHPSADTLQSFAEGLLAEADRVVLESHLTDCEACRGELAEWRSLFGMLNKLPLYEPAPGFVARVMAGVQLPDPWYVRAAARVGTRLQAFVPRTTRGWAIASACLALPLTIFTALAAWLLSKPGVTPEGLLSFAVDRTIATYSQARESTLATLLQSDLALGLARALDTVTSAGVGAATALAATIALATALSAWVLYQNLFRKPETREDHTYVSFSF